ncbi:hypothetical protein ACGFWE_43195 [Streptomyces sp. NPDC048523]|uniref:hypothetical protein n=1 Tax=Streptomyces sp. NPDC048523 TaxID=3365567 RepID=UPI00371EE1FF
MSAHLALPPEIRRQLRPVLQLVRPVLEGAGSGSGRTSSVVVCPARPTEVRRQVTACCAVYVAWDNRYGCRYVGSVRRQGRSAVGDRLGEHYAHRTAGTSRRTSWCLLTVLPLVDGIRLEAVRNAEGWTARLLNPVDGSAHPRVDLTYTPASLAFVPHQAR